MKAIARNGSAVQGGLKNIWSLSRLPSANLQLVTTYELEHLQGDLTRGNVPPDLKAKLDTLAKGSLGQRFIQQNCWTMIALLQASHQGTFVGATRAECERLLRVLAYVRKDDDAIPDYRPEGFLDDQQEVRMVTNELASLLQAFKAWRLQHQVPTIWRAHVPQATARFNPIGLVA